MTVIPTGCTTGTGTKGGDQGDSKMPHLRPPLAYQHPAGDPRNRLCPWCDAMADRSGALDTRGQNPRHVAILISEAVNLNRLTRGTLTIARAAAETETENKKGETIA